MVINAAQANPELFKNIRDMIKKARVANDKLLINAHNKAKEKDKKPSTKKSGSVIISNTDTVTSCARIRSRLLAKLQEIFDSDLDEKAKMSLARDIMMQIDKVEQKISEIRRREKAVAEERRARKTESEHEKRKRRHDMAKRTATIKREYLYHASEGGLDPSSYLPAVGASSVSPAVSFNFSFSGGVIFVANVLSVKLSTSICVI